jgi:Flp pilus assembly protein TadG
MKNRGRLPMCAAMAPGHRKTDGGQTVVLVTVFMMSLLGAAALAIDLGNFYLTKRAVQAAADASALAGASQLPVSQSAALTTANGMYAKNGKASDSVSVSVTTTNVSGDSVTTTATRATPGYFAKLFGIASANIQATATATIGSYTGYSSKQNVMPWGVMKGNYTLGSSYTIYGDSSSSNQGALSLDVRSGSSCVNANGANDYRNTINGGLNACPISVGDLVDTKPGNNTGPTAQGLNSRIGTWKTFSQIVQLDGNGQYTILDPASPQLVLIPIVLNTDGSTTWPNGSSQVKVVGFAWFVITGCGSPSIQGTCKNSDGKYVNGTFVGLSQSDSAATVGSWSPSSGSATSVMLTQ